MEDYRKINEVFEFEGTKLKCVPKDDCIGCYFGNAPFLCKRRSALTYQTGFCSAEARADSQSVIFIEVNN